MYVSTCQNYFKTYYKECFLWPYLSYLSYGRINDYLKKKNISPVEKKCYLASVKIAILKAINYCKNYLDNDSSINIQKGFLDTKEVLRNKEQLEILFTCLDNDSFFEESVIHISNNDFFPIFNATIPDYDYVAFSSLFKQYKNSFYKIQAKHYSKKGVIRAKARKLKQNISLLMHFKIIRFLKSSIKIAVSNDYKEANKSFDYYFSTDCYKKKVFHSFKRRVDDIIGWINDCSGNFFIYVQPEDFHPKSTFWTFDTNDYQLVSNELNEALELAKRIPRKMKCNIYSFLSIKYIDKQIERLFNALKEKNLLKNTIIVITADHGYWEYYDCIRSNAFGAMDETRLHIPCLIYDHDSGHKVVDKMLNHYCLPNTILEMAGLIESNVMETSYKKSPNNEYLISENFSFGSPDPLLKPVEYTVFNKRYKLVARIMLTDEPDINDCVSLFDLEKDKYELVNRIKKKKYRNMKYIMFNMIKERHCELKRMFNYIDFYDMPIIYSNVLNNWKKID